MRDFCRILVLLLVTALPACQKRANAPPAKSWYDPKALLVSLVEEERTNAASASAVPLDELPLYDLQLGLNAELDTFKLVEDVYYTNDTKQALDEVVLRLYANSTADKPIVTLEKGECRDGDTCAVTQPEPSVIVVKPASSLAPGGRLRARLSLVGVLPAIEASRTTLLGQGLESMGRMTGEKKGGDYGLLARGEEITSLASFFPIVARRKANAWVKKDDSTMGDLGGAGLSHVRLRLVVPSGAQVATSGVIQKRGPYKSDDAGAREELRIVAGMVRDFSLLVSQRFEVATRNVGSVVVRSHFLGRDKAAGDRVLDYAAHSLAVYEKRFGRYPYRDLDVVEAPLVGGAGGVEFSGLVTVASMLYRPASEGLGMLAGLLGGAGGGNLMEKATGSMLEFTTAHEVAHQWFPGLIGSDSREHPYLDESLAQYSAVIYFIDRYGMARAKEEAAKQVAMNYQMMRLMGGEDAPADRPVDAFESEIAYAGLVYGKAPYLWSKIKLLVGDDAFFAALSRYVAKNRFRNVAPRALVDELAQGDKADQVRALARRWLDEAHGDEDLGKLDMRQLMAEMLGPEAASQMGPELDMAMKLMLQLFGGKKGDPGELLQQLLKSGQKPAP
jgi:hypothetical protein